MVPSLRHEVVLLTREVPLLPGTRTNGVLPPLPQGVAPAINGAPKAGAVVVILRLREAAQPAAALHLLTLHPVVALHQAAPSGVAAVAGARVVAVAVAAAVVVPAAAEGNMGLKTGMILMINQLRRYR